MCRSKPVGITEQKVQEFTLQLTMFMFSKKRTAKHKKTSQVSIVFHDEFVHVVQC